MSDGAGTPASVSGRADDIRARIRARGGAATIYDIAELAGVNPSTVSRALGKPGRIGAATAARVQAAASELNFRINPAARTLQTGKTGMLGLVVADITNPVVLDVVRGAEHEAADAGYALMIAESQESSEGASDVVERMLSRVDALVLVSPRLAPERILDAAGRKPVVLINMAVGEVPSVVSDVEAGVNEAIDHLVELGHASVVFLAGPSSSWISMRRSEAIVVAAAGRADLAIVGTGPNASTIVAGRNAAGDVLASRATAVIADNDLMAMGLMQALADAGVRVPEQVSVVGFDDISGSDLIVPALSTVRTDFEAAGRRAVALTLDESQPSRAVTFLPTGLIVRGSTGPAPR